MDVAADEEYVAQQKFQREHEYLMRMIADDKAPRLAPALQAGLRVLKTHEHVPHVVLIATMLRESDVQVKTLENVVRRLCAHGFVVKTGESPKYYYGRKLNNDMRVYDLGEWPEPEVAS